jgi:hypothetical protein
MIQNYIINGIGMTVVAASGIGYGQNSNSHPNAHYDKKKKHYNVYNTTTTKQQQHQTSIFLCNSKSRQKIIISNLTTWILLMFVSCQMSEEKRLLKQTQIQILDLLSIAYDAFTL